MKFFGTHSLRRFIATLLTIFQIVISLPVADLQAMAREQWRAAVNRTVPATTPVPAFPKFSASPSNSEITAARVFEEPLVPMGAPTTADENRSLASALMQYLKGGTPEDLSQLEAFLQTYPHSAWRPSLLMDIGIVYRKTGYFTRALSVWNEAWSLSRNESDPIAHAIADRAVAEWAELNARLGRYEVLEPLFEELKGRDIGGSSAEKIRGAKQGLWLMQNRPQDAFRCGPMALDRILAFEHADYHRDERIAKSESTLRGMSLPQVLELGTNLGMQLQMARRAPGAVVLLPAVIHWKAGHYAALLKEDSGRFLIQDPTFGDEFWVTRKALDDESSGYFLVRSGQLPQGWATVGEREGLLVWGKGNTSSDDTQQQKPCDAKAHSCGSNDKGMPIYDIHLMLVNLNITDSPVGYQPPRGPVVNFRVTYNHRDAFQPAVFSYSNLGPKWTFDWMTYLKDDPSNPSASAFLYMAGGGEETYSGYNSGTQSYAPHMQSRAVVVRTSSSPVVYERRLPDGSVQVFAQPDGASTFPRKVFLTEWKDRLGNEITFTYDSSLRMVAVTDAIGQVTTLSYELTSDPLKITKVTDPFGRYATFEYTATGRLSRITDVMGLQSQFTYGTGDFINAMTTPYGTTTFVYSEDGHTRWLEATDPVGGTEHVEYRPNAPGIPYSDPGETVPTGISLANFNLYYRDTYYWDKRAWSLYPGDYTKAIMYHWLHTTDLNVTSGVLESVKKPLENRVWFTYPGQPNAYTVGSSAQPSVIARVLDSADRQVYLYEYNAAGKVTKFTDPGITIRRETDFIYGTNNVADPDPATGTGTDLLQVQQKNGTGYDVLETFTYNAHHEPLTHTDAARQTTTFTYRSTGELSSILTPPRGSLTTAQRTTSFSYYADNAALGAGRLQTITGPVTGATTDFSYDSKGRPATVTESDGYAVTTTYDDLDRPTRITYPDSTYEQIDYNKLDPSQSRDRLGRWTHYFYDAERRLTSTLDPQGRDISQMWCKCGVLDKLIDANGNTTSWSRDAQGRITTETRADSSTTQYVYENAISRMKQRTDPKGQKTNYTYFTDDNVNSITYTNATIATATVSFTYDSVYNRASTMVDGTGTTTYSYYPVTTGGTLGATQLSSVDGPLSNDTIAFTYDELGRVASRSVNGTANTIANTYDPLGRISSVTNVLGEFDYSYVNQTSRLSSITYPNGQTTSFSYLANSADRRLSEIHNQLSGGATLSKFNYTYDATGNITSWTQQRDNGTSAVIRAYDFGYDRADQLTSAIYRTTDAIPTILKRYGYAYDPAGNRTTEQIDDYSLKATYNNMNRLQTQLPGGSVRFEGTLSEPATVTVMGKPATVTSSNTFGATVAVGSGTSSVQIVAKDYSGNTLTNTYDFGITGATTTFTHDSNGNLTVDGTRTFEWDAENRLTAINSGTHRSEFTYDGLSRRVRIVEKDNSITTTDTRFVWCGEQICEERDSTGGTATKRFFSQGEQRGTDNFFYTRDHLGSIRELVDITGATRGRYDYDPYGRTTKASGDKDATFTFTGIFSHGVSGLVLTPYRAYDGNLGRWLSEDPAGLEGGPNLYGYVDGGATRFVDPLGLGPLGATIGGAIGGYLGGVVGLAGLAGGPAVAVTEPLSVAMGVSIGAALGHGVEETLRLFPRYFNKDTSTSKEDEGRQDRKLTPWEIDKLKDAGHDIEALKSPRGKGAGKLDLYKDPAGNIKIKPKGGQGPGEPTGININDLGGFCPPRRK